MYTDINTYSKLNMLLLSLYKLYEIYINKYILTNKY